MREIKFRAWNDIDKISIEWPTLAASPVLLCGLIKNNIRHHRLIQYTGRNDRNGVEICEGDICVNESGRIAKIIYLDSGACFDAVALNEKGDSKGFEPQMWSYRVRVIGNIYQNPELLESK